MNELSFYRKEWELLAAFLYGYQEMATEIYDDGHTKRCWLPMERLEMAFKAIQAKNVQFKCTRYDAPNNKFVTFAEPPSNEVRDCKRIFNGIMDWDRSVLSECFDSTHRLCENLGFERHDPAPVEMKRPAGVRDIDDLASAPVVTPKEVTVTVAPVSIAKAISQSIETGEPVQVAIDPGHAETLKTGEVVENLTPEEKSRVAKKAQEAMGIVGQAPAKRGPGRPPKVPSV